MIVVLKIFITLMWMLSIFICFNHNKENLLTISNFVILSFTVIFYIPLIGNMYDWCNDSGFLTILSVGFAGMFIAIYTNKNRVKTKKKRVQISIGKFCLLSDQYEISFVEKTGTICLLTLIVFIYYMINLIIALRMYSWNIFALLLRDRIGLYSNSLTNIEGFEKMIRPLSLILIVYFFEKRKKIGILLWLVVLLFKLFILHGRFEIIMHCLLLVLYYNYHIKTIKASTILLFLACASGFLSIANYVRTGLYTEIGSFSLKALFPRTVINQLFRASSSTTTIFYLVYKRNIPCDCFAQYLLYLPISFIPRFLWPQKPIVSYFWRLTKALYGTYPYEDNSRIPVETSTLWGEAYHEGGILNVFAVTLIYIWLLILFIRFIKKYKYSDLIIYSMIISIPMNIRGGLHSNIMSWIEVLIPIVVMHFLGFYKQSKVINDINIINNFL